MLISHLEALWSLYYRALFEDPRVGKDKGLVELYLHLQCIFHTIGYSIVRIALEGHPRRVVLTLVIIWSAGQPSNLPTQCLLLIADISSARSAGYNVLLEAISLFQLTSALLGQRGMGGL